MFLNSYLPNLLVICFLFNFVLSEQTAAAVDRNKYKPKCDAMEKEFKSLCAQPMKSNVCALPNEAAVSKALDIMDKAPQLSAQDIALQEKLFSVAKPTMPDILEYGESGYLNCWDSVMAQIWQSVASALPASGKIRERGIAVLKKVTAPGSFSPFARNLMMKLTMLENAIDRKVVSAPATAAKEISDMKDSLEVRARADDAKLRPINDPLPAQSILKEKRDFVYQKHIQLQKWVAAHVK